MLEILDKSFIDLGDSENINFKCNREILDAKITEDDKAGYLCLLHDMKTYL